MWCIGLSHVCCLLSLIGFGGRSVLIAEIEKAYWANEDNKENESATDPPSSDRLEQTSSAQMMKNRFQSTNYGSIDGESGGGGGGSPGSPGSPGYDRLVDRPATWHGPVSDHTSDISQMGLEHYALVSFRDPGSVEMAMSRTKFAQKSGLIFKAVEGEMASVRPAGYTLAARASREMVKSSLNKAHLAKQKRASANKRKLAEKHASRQRLTGAQPPEVHVLQAKAGGGGPGVGGAVTAIRGALRMSGVLQKGHHVDARDTSILEQYRVAAGGSPKTQAESTKLGMNADDAATMAAWWTDVVAVHAGVLPLTAATAAAPGGGAAGGSSSGGGGSPYEAMQREMRAATQRLRDQRQGRQRTPVGHAATSSSSGNSNNGAGRAPRGRTPRHGAGGRVTAMEAQPAGQVLPVWASPRIVEAGNEQRRQAQAKAAIAAAAETGGLLIPTHHEAEAGSLPRWLRGVGAPGGCLDAFTGAGFDCVDSVVGAKLTEPQLLHLGFVQMKQRKDAMRSLQKIMADKEKEKEEKELLVKEAQIAMADHTQEQEGPGEQRQEEQQVAGLRGGGGRVGSSKGNARGRGTGGRQHGGQQVPREPRRVHGGWTASPAQKRRPNQTTPKAAATAAASASPAQRRRRLKQTKPLGTQPRAGERPATAPPSASASSDGAGRSAARPGSGRGGRGARRHVEAADLGELYTRVDASCAFGGAVH